MDKFDVDKLVSMIVLNKGKTQVEESNLPASTQSKHGGIFPWKVIGIMCGHIIHRKQLAALQDWLASRSGSIETIFVNQARTPLQPKEKRYKQFLNQTKANYSKTLDGYFSPIQYIQEWLTVNAGTLLFSNKVPIFTYMNTHGAINYIYDSYNYQQHTNANKGFRQVAGLCDMIIALPSIHSKDNEGRRIDAEFDKYLAQYHHMGIDIVQFKNKEGITTGYP